MTQRDERKTLLITTASEEDETKIEVQGDKDEEFVKKGNKIIDACCESFWGSCWKNFCKCLESIFESVWNCLCSIGRFLRDYIWDFLYVMFIRTIFRATWKLLRRIPNALGGVVNPLLLFTDAYICCDTNGKKGYPLLSIFGRILEGICLLTGYGNVLPPKKLWLGRRAVALGMLLAIYCCAQVIDLINCGCIYECSCVDFETGDSVWPRFNPFHSMGDHRLRNMHSAWLLLVVPVCIWAVTVGWLEGKMAVLSWIPNAIEKTEENIRIESLKRHRKEALKYPHQQQHSENYKISKLEVCSHYFEFLLSIPAGVIGMLWDVIYEATLIKSWCKNNPYAKRGRENCFYYCNCCGCCDCCADDIAVAAANQAAQPDEPYTALIHRKMSEFNSLSIAANNYARGKTDKRSYAELELERLQVEHYLKDAANGEVSEPVMPSKGVKPPSIANWKLSAGNNQQVRQLWALHSYEGLPIGTIATCYNHTLYAIRNDQQLPPMLSVPLLPQSSAQLVGSMVRDEAIAFAPSADGRDIL